MKLVRRRIGCSDDQRYASHRPSRPTTRSGGLRATNRSKGQKPENGVFGKVRRFAHNQVDQIELLGGSSRLDPMDHRLQKARGVLSRAGIGRHERNKSHPQKNGQPMFVNASHE